MPSSRVNIRRRTMQVLPLGVVIVLAIGFVPRDASSEASSVLGQAGSPMLMVGEELRYSAWYSIFHLGTIVVKVVDRKEENGRTIFRAKAIIDSSPGLPFVNLHIRFESEFDDSMISRAWTAEDSSKSETIVRELRFDYDSSRVYATKIKRLPDGSETVESIDTSKITAKCQDGFSLFYFARGHVRQAKEMNVPTFIEKEQVNTFFNFTNKTSDEEIDSVVYPIEVVEFNGRADFVGVFGLTGGFRGWFSNDDARVPIVARMNVILGSIKVELEDWHRPGWIPPKYSEK